MNTRPPVSLFNLPAPPAEAIARSTALSDRIRQEIREDAGISFARYMELALYDPELGYYRSGSAIFGSKGDFVTAPEVSPLFGRCLATQCATVMDALAGGSILEIGAGSGRLVVDVLLALAALDRLPERYVVLETSGALKSLQQQSIAKLPEDLRARVHWINTLPESGFSGLILANEVLDAMPVRRFIKRAHGLHEQTVTDEAGTFVWGSRPADEHLQAFVTEVEHELDQTLPPGYCSEVNDWLKPWFSAVAGCLQRGVALIFDYGYPRHEYYHPQRSDGTLLCHFRHRAHHDPFFYPGLQDITASVDFSAVAESGHAAGLGLLGYSSQAQFLIGAGALEMSVESAGNLKLVQDLKRLLMPDEMGERFQVMGFSKALTIELAGFSARDMRHRL